MTNLTASCPCGASIVSAGRDESSRLNVAEWEGLHFGHTFAQRVLLDVAYERGDYKRAGWTDELLDAADSGRRGI